jgi:hypothetical protein
VSGWTQLSALSAVTVRVSQVCRRFGCDLRVMRAIVTSAEPVQTLPDKEERFSETHRNRDLSAMRCGNLADSELRSRTPAEAGLNRDGARWSWRPPACNSNGGSGYLRQ